MEARNNHQNKSVKEPADNPIASLLRQFAANIVSDPGFVNYSIGSSGQTHVPAPHLEDRPNPVEFKWFEGESAKYQSIQNICDKVVERYRVQSNNNNKWDVPSTSTTTATSNVIHVRDFELKNVRQKDPWKDEIPSPPENTPIRSPNNSLVDDSDDVNGYSERRLEGRDFVRALTVRLRQSITPENL